MTPFYRLTTPLTRAWAINREVRHKLARWLAKTYAKTGVAVCTDRLFVVAWVNPLAQIKFATPPFRKIERHQCANNPSWSECQCRTWFDPESGGPWGKRQTPAHHPLCIYDEKAMGRWREIGVPEKVAEQAAEGGFLEPFSAG
ncbi:MAG TPA: hypothetical protein VG937_00055 [Polyangiaceae bacterium]|nr:hypothetical protein [Polyangiaceae bacterium]